MPGAGGPVPEEDRGPPRSGEEGWVRDLPDERMRGVVRPRAMATLALAGFGFWLAVVVALPVLTPDAYDPVEQSISALALVRFGGFMDAAFLAFGLGSVALAFGLYRSVEGVPLAPLLLAVCGVLWTLLGFFRTGSAGIEATVHGAVATASFLLIIVVMMLFARSFRDVERWRSFATPTAAWAVVSVVALFSIPTMGEEVFGASERVFVAAFVSWMMATAMRLRFVAERTGARPR